MSARPEMRIVCDRCANAVILPIHNTTVHARAAGPDGWLTLTLGSDPSTPPSHLCPSCASGLRDYMAGEITELEQLECS